MKKTNLVYTTIGIALGAGLMISVNSFAMMDVGPRGERGAMERQHRQQDPIRNFINSDITDEEKEELKEAMKVYREEGKKLFETFKEAKEAGEDTTDIEEQLKEHRIAMLDIFDDYISEDKADEWAEFKANAEEKIESGELVGPRERQVRPRGPQDLIRNFIDPDLTDEEKEELKTAIEAHEEEGKELLEILKEAKEAGEDTTDIEEQLKEHRDSMLDIFDDYISEDKADEWIEFKAEAVEKGPQMRRGKMDRGMRGRPQGPLMGVRDFIDPDLTDEEKEDMKSDMEDHREDMKTLFEDIRDTKQAGEDTTDLESQIQEVMIAGLDILDKYIDEDKTEEWEEYKAKMVENIEKGPKPGVRSAPGMMRPDSNMRNNPQGFRAR